MGVGGKVELGGSGRFFEARHLLTFSALRMGTYLRWVLILDWVPIRLNMVNY